MRVALTYPDVSRTGGIERVVLECARHLHRRGHEVHLFASRWQADSLPKGATVHRVPSPSRPAALAMLQYRRRATRALRAIAPSAQVHASFGSQSPLGGVLWVPSVHKAAMEMILARRGRGRRLVQQVNPDHLMRLRFEREYYAGRGYAGLIACTAQVRAELARYHDVPEEDVVVLPLGFDDSEFNVNRRAELRERARSALGYGPAERVVVFVANELERKGFDTLLHAIARLRFPEVNLLVVGKVDPARHRSEIERLGLQSRVRYTGPAADVGFFHAASDVFALPTRYEPWGLAIVEALASGLPVVTTRLAGASVAITPAENGCLLDDPDDVDALASSLERLIGAELEAATVSASVSHLRWPAVLFRYEEILRSRAA
jgi:UDP-glucose:(heptosyl)LPS alpha-1,3-glucosyltransferase